jgi:hypothetical protein
VTARVCAQLDPLIDAQIAKALGLKFLVYRDRRTGKFVRVTPSMLEAGVGDQELIEVWEEPPSTAAFSDLMNRALDKPSESVHVDVAQTSQLAVFIAEARQRLQPKSVDELPLTPSLIVESGGSSTKRA